MVFLLLCYSKILKIQIFRGKFQFLPKISLFGQNLDSKFLFLPKNIAFWSIFGDSKLEC